MSENEEAVGPSVEREEPHHIDNDCQECGTELVLYDKADEELLKQSDSLSTPNTDDIWYDEWICPECLHGIIIDHP